MPPSPGGKPEVGLGRILIDGKGNVSHEIRIEVPAGDLDDMADA
jgi:hypothetical protein